MSHAPKHAIIKRLHAAVKNISDTTNLCTTTIPKGVPIQLFYENFSLSRIYDIHGKEITSLIVNDVPQIIESDYLWSICDGDFTINGQLWLPRSSKNNKAKIEKCLNQEILRHRERFFFTPSWIIESQGRSLFATYDEFITVMKEQFLMSEHRLTTPQTIHQAIELCDRDLPYQNLPVNEKSSMKQIPNSDGLIIRCNEISDVNEPTTITIDNTPIALVAPHSQSFTFLEKTNPESLAFVKQIDILPDRFGRIRPILITEPYYGPEDTLEIPLPQLDDLLVRGYEEGDVIKLIRAGPVALADRIVERSESPTDNYSNHPQNLQRLSHNQCPYCSQSLVFYCNEFYCNNPRCGNTNIERVFHACSPSVLDLPISRDELASIQNDVYWNDPYPLISFLHSGRDELYELGWNEEYLEQLLQDFTMRYNQLHGHGCSREVQLMTQGRFIDALSLRGLYTKNIRQLQNGLSNGYLSWQTLPMILMDSKSLMVLGIPPDNAAEIALAAQQRSVELLQFGGF